MQIIVFTLGDKYYALRTDKVEEITKDVNITKVPNAPTWVEGIINLRGNVITLINLSKLLQQEDNLCYNNIIIVHDEEEKAGVLVKDVIEVVDIEEDDIQIVNQGSAEGILGIVRINGEIINIIDMNILISKNEG